MLPLSLDLVCSWHFCIFTDLPVACCLSGHLFLHDISLSTSFSDDGTFSWLFPTLFTLLLSSLLFPCSFLLSSVPSFLLLSTLRHISTVFASLLSWHLYSWLFFRIYTSSSSDCSIIVLCLFVCLCVFVCFSVQPLPAAHGGTLRSCLLGASHACVGGRPLVEPPSLAGRRPPSRPTVLHGGWPPSRTTVCKMQLLYLRIYFL